MRKFSKSFQYGEHTVTLESGHIARQADGAVLVTMDDTIVLVTAVGRREAEEKTLALRRLGTKEQEFLALGDAIARIKEEATPPSGE